jgi:hypothetical protein
MISLQQKQTRKKNRRRNIFQLFYMDQDRNVMVQVNKREFEKFMMLPKKL